MGKRLTAAPRYSLHDGPSVWDVVGLPAGAGSDSASLIELQHIHGGTHGVQPVDFVSMGVTISGRDPSKLLINVFQDWSGMCTCFNAIELEKKETSNGGDTAGVRINSGNTSSWSDGSGIGNRV